MTLDRYRRKRDFAKTPEPRGAAGRNARASGAAGGKSDGPVGRYLIQKHAASRLHYDFRLEMDGVLKSWAVPKGPSFDTHERRLAVEVEDHPLEYGDFEGVIPEDQYGGGTVMLWDRGTWRSLSDHPDADYRAGNLKFELAGKRLRGRWALVRMKPRPGEKPGRHNWLLIKERDQFVRDGDGSGAVDRHQTSVASRRTMERIARDGDRVWHSNAGGAAAAAPPKRSSRGAKPAKQALAETAAPATRKSGRRQAAAGAAAGPGGLDPSAIAGARKAKLAEEVAPELATPVAAPPTGENWLHEIKFDGYRLLVRIAGGEVRLISRHGKDWTDRFPAIAEAFAGLGLDEALIDSEVVHLEPDGTSSFGGLQQDLSEGRTDHLVDYAFDLLHLKGYELTRVLLEARKHALAQLLGGSTEGRLRYSDHIIGNADRFLAAACAAGLEGIISKRRDRPHEPGRSRSWLKVKCFGREEMVVIGWTDPGGSRHGLGALLLGYYDPKGGLHYAGRVGSGFTGAVLADLRRRLAPLARKKPAAPALAAQAGRDVHWVEPELVAEIRFGEWTRDRVMRHPVFLGLREDKGAKEVVLDLDRAAAAAQASSTEEAAPAVEAAPAPAPAIKRGGSGTTEVAGVRLTHPDKLLYPAARLTKLDLARYYEAVAPAILPHIKGRPLSLVRCPDGEGGECFFQKHIGRGMPPELKPIEIPEKEGSAVYLLAEDKAGLIALVQMGVLEIHVWGSRAPKIETPDRVIFDLDPDEGLAWNAVTAAALEVRDRLAGLGLRSWAKTTGGKGLHVVVPVEPRTDWEAVKGFAKEFAEGLVDDAPARYTATLSKKARSGKIFVDYLRNQRGATAIAPYSARARAQATVAVPVSWDEVEAGIRSDRFTIKTVPGELAKRGADPWAELVTVRQRLPKAKPR